MAQDPGEFEADPRARTTIERMRTNAFHVLGLTPAASRQDIEREGQKILGMLALGLAAARTYATPVGPGQRDEDLVRRAMATLRDPDRRLEEELWARLSPSDPSAEAARPSKVIAPPWLDARGTFGWGDRRSR